MPSLDEYYRYLEKQEKGAPSPAAAKGTNGTTGTIETMPPAAAKGRDRGVAPRRDGGGGRYVLRNGVTVLRSDEDVNEVSNEVIPEIVIPSGEALTTDHAAAVAAEVEAGTERPVSLAETAMWQRLPHHLQTLARLTDADETAEEEVARKYYSRGFKESRRQLIERLLDPTLTLEETARVLGVCPATVRRYTNRGVLPHHRTVGQQRRFRLSDVLAFLEAQDGGARKRASALAADEAVASAA